MLENLITDTTARFASLIAVLCLSRLCLLLPVGVVLLGDTPRRPGELDIMSSTWNLRAATLDTGPPKLQESL